MEERYFDLLIEELRTGRQLGDGLLASLDDAIRNPTRTDADEMRRRGINALSRGWLPEAIHDLAKAIDQFPYDPIAHIGLGLAFARQGQAVDAAASFHRAVRYGVDAPTILAGACR